MCDNSKSVEGYKDGSNANMSMQNAMSKSTDVNPDGAKMMGYGSLTGRSSCMKTEPLDVSVNLQSASRWIRNIVDPLSAAPGLKTEPPEPPLYAGPAAAAAYAPYAATKPKEQDTVAAAPTQYYCELCARAFTRQSNLLEHTLRHAGKVYSCDVCHKQFSCLRYLTRHSRIHNAAAAATTAVAPKTSPTTTTSTTAAKARNTLKSYLCAFCNKKFSCKSHLVAHTRIHTGEKPYSCDVCAKSFNHKSHLTAHIRVHTGEKPYKCRICDKRFRDRSNLGGHMRVHSGQKPFACTICSEPFGRKALLRQHERTHAHSTPGDAKRRRQKLFSCRICSNTFTYNNRKNEKPLVCEVCTKEFTVNAPRAEEDRGVTFYAVAHIM